MLAGGHAWIGRPLIGSEWGTSFLTTAGGLVFAAIGFALMPRRAGSWAAFGGAAVAAAASLNTVRLTLAFPTTIDITALGLISAGLIGLAVVALGAARGSKSQVWRVAALATLLAVVGAATYLVHDVVLAISGQWIPDALLLSGSLFAWIAARRIAPTDAGEAAPGAVGEPL